VIFFCPAKRNNDWNKKRSGKYSAAFPAKLCSGLNRVATGCAYERLWGDRGHWYGRGRSTDRGPAVAAEFFTGCYRFTTTGAG
jgi:hypothetical protein